ncbi:MAG: hypothetical protein WC222_04145 [Parachlamydiales bacterium]|jgi:hypothetical protein
MTVLDPGHDSHSSHHIGPLGPSKSPNKDVKLEGHINKNSNNKKILTVVDAENNILFTGEVKEKKGFKDIFKPLRKLTIVDPLTQRAKQVYVKVDTIAIHGLPGAQGSLKNKKAQDALFKLANEVQLEQLQAQFYRNLEMEAPRKNKEPLEEIKAVHEEKAVSHPHRASPRAAIAQKLQEQQKTINEKVELFKKVEIKTPIHINYVTSEGVDKKRINIPLNEDQMRELATEIELNKDKWMEEADKSGFWIKKEVTLEGMTFPVSIEIYPKGRDKEEKLGRVDIQMDFIARGAAKKVFKTLHYDTGRLNAGAYVKGPTVKEQMSAERKMMSGLKKMAEEGEGKVKKKILISKATDLQIKMKKDGTATNHVKFTQKKFDGAMYDTLVDKLEMPDGTPLTPEIKTKLMLSSLDSLEQLHKTGIIHVDIKPDNMLFDGGKFEVRLVDYDLSQNKGEAANKIKGTPFYIAPENLIQWSYKQDVHYTEQSDLYSLGTSFADGDIDPWWDMDTGIPDIGMLLSIKNGTEQIPAEEPADKNSFEWGVWKMTHFDPNQRFQSAAEAKTFFQSLTF